MKSMATAMRRDALHDFTEVDEWSPVEKRGRSQASVQEGQATTLIDRGIVGTFPSGPEIRRRPWQSFRVKYRLL